MNTPPQRFFAYIARNIRTRSEQSWSDWAKDYLVAAVPFGAVAGLSAVLGWSLAVRIVVIAWSGGVLGTALLRLMGRAVMGVRTPDKSSRDDESMSADS